MLRLKSSEDKVVSQRERKALPCFVAESCDEKCQKGNYFFPRAHPIVIYRVQLTGTKQFCDGGLTQRKDFFNN